MIYIYIIVIILHHHIYMCYHIYMSIGAMCQIINGELQRQDFSKARYICSYAVLIIKTFRNYTRNTMVSFTIYGSSIQYWSY